MRLIHFAAILALALMWGASFMFVAVMVREISPVAVAWIRLGGGAAVILAIAFGRRTPVPRTLGSVRTQDRNVPPVGSIAPSRYAALRLPINSRQRNMNNSRRANDVGALSILK